MFQFEAFIFAWIFDQTTPIDTVDSTERGPDSNTQAATNAKNVSTSNYSEAQAPAKLPENPSPQSKPQKKELPPVQADLQAPNSTTSTPNKVDSNPNSAHANPSIVSDTDAMSAPPADPGKLPSKWIDRITMDYIVDAYASINYNFPRSQTGVNANRAYDISNGFAFSWAGFDLAYDAQPVGGMISLRFGPSAAQLNGDQHGMEYVKQGYATWRPSWASGRLSFDLGKFDTLYGAELGDSQLNMNYTRSALYWLGQPFNHTGLRVGLQPLDNLGINFMVVNGWNVVVDNNRGKTFGIQFALTPNDRFGAYLGYCTGPEQTELIDHPTIPDQELSVDDVNKKFRHLIDLVISVQASDRLSLLFNADFALEPLIRNPLTGSHRNIFWYGLVAAGRLALTEQWATSLRGEFYSDPDDYTTGFGIADTLLGGATFTVDFSPVSNLLIRMDNRIDAASQSVFSKGLNDTSRTQFTTTIGVVVSTF